MSYKLMFMGSPLFSVSTLQNIHASFPEFDLHVITQADKPKGRGQKLSETAIKKEAKKRQLSIYTPESKEALVDIVNEQNPDLIVIIAYGMIIPKTITDHYFCMNVHASILPKYRGPSPIHAALLNGDTETGVTLIKINEKMDEGDILHIERILINDNDNNESLHSKLSELGATTTVNYIRNHILEQKVTLTAQKHDEATYCQMIKKDDAKLNLKDSPETLVNHIRAFSPKPGAYVELKTHRLKILEARIEDSQLLPLIVQPEGKGPMSFKDYCLGHPEGKDLFSC